MSDKNPITLEGQEKLQNELDHLVKNDREEIKRVIQEARELGDLKENAEYHAAKEKQGLIEGRISKLQHILSTSQVVETSKIQSDKIIFGAKVSLIDVDKDKVSVYKIVGDAEADSKKGHISFKSPLGKALIGKEEGDTVIVKAPKGDIEYEVESFEFE